MVTSILKNKKKNIIHDFSFMISKDNSEVYYNAEICGCDKKNIYFESAIDPQPGSDIYIMMDKDNPICQGLEARKPYRAKVKWCKEILNEYTFDYRTGIHISEIIN